MSYTLITDPHLGLSRKTHTTRESSKRWAEEIHKRALDEVQKDSGNVILVGDLFDKTYNTETVIQQGIEVSSHCRWVLAGNHDQPNRADVSCSIDLVGNVVKQKELGKVNETYQVQEGIFMVPHHATQELFMEAVWQARDQAAMDAGYKFLFLHCNRGELPNMTEETLTIYDEDENTLLETFDRIIYGHIHQPSIEKDSKVVVLGNVFPTSFSDITHKFKYRLDTETNELTKECIFDARVGFKGLSLGSPIELTKETLFVEVTGRGERSEVAEYVHKVWEEYPDLLAVRNNCDYVENGMVVEDVDLSDLHTVITKGLNDEKQLELYNQLREELCN